MVKKEMSESKTYAFLGIFLTVIGFLIILITKKGGKYALFYAKQGLILFITIVIINVIAKIPIINLLTPILWIAFLILWIIGIVYSLSGEMKDIPFIGTYARKLKL